MPNTVSPHYQRNAVIPTVCKPFTSYKDDVITSELKESLETFVESMD